MPTTIFQDSFVAPFNTHLDAHTPYLGSGWHRHARYPGTAVIQSQLVVISHGNKVYLADIAGSATPAYITAELNVLPTALDRTGVVMRSNDPPTDATPGVFYAFTYKPGEGFVLWKRFLNQYNNYQDLVLGSVAVPSNTSGTFWVTLNTNGTTLTASVVNNPGKHLHPDGTWQDDPHAQGAIQVVDSSHSDGKPGIFLGKSFLNADGTQKYTNIDSVEIKD